MLDLLLRNARMVFPRERECHGSLGVKDGKIAGVYLDGAAPAARRTLDAGGRPLLPGVIDPHIHLGGRRASFDEECLTETRAALKGGITTVGCYLREKGSYIGRVEEFRARAEGKVFADILFHLVILEPEQIPDIPLYAARYGYPAFKFYLHAIPSLPIMDAGNLLGAFEVLAGLPRPALACVHAEISALCVWGRARLKAGNPSTLADWTESSPEGAEAEAVRLCASLSKRSGARVYVVHLTSASGLEAVREAKRRGVPLFCESTSTYLFFDNRDPAGMMLRRQPPVRHPADREALWTGVADGAIDTLGTDNVTVAAEESNFNAPFWETRGGLAGLPTHVVQTLHEGHHVRGLPLWLLADRMCRRPAELFGLYPRKGALRVGADADLVLVDPDREKVVRAAETGSRSDFSPIEGRALRGWPAMVVKGGDVVVEEGELVCEPGIGRCLNRISA